MSNEQERLINLTNHAKIARLILQFNKDASKLSEALRNLQSANNYRKEKSLNVARRKWSDISIKIQDVAIFFERVYLAQNPEMDKHHLGFPHFSENDIEKLEKFIADEWGGYH